MTQPNLSPPTADQPAPQPAPLAPAELAERLAATAGRLSDVIEAEIDLLHAYKVAEVERLQVEKQALTQDYEALVRRLEERPETVDEMDETRRSAVKEAAERLVRATEANAVALRAGIEANGELMSSIAHAVKEQRSRSAQYQADGRAIGADEDLTPVSISLNEVL